MRGADFCHQCGNCLVPDPAINSSAKTPIDPTAISHLIKSTSNYFLVWICCITFLGAAALFYYFLNSISPIIIGSVAFVYAQIFLTAKLDELSIAIRHSPQPIAYISLLLPILGTIICYQRLDHLASTKIQTS